MRIPIILITGYLGAGKTTVINTLLHQENRKIALIVNDMGSINIDADLLENAQKDTMEMVQLQNGCICCTLRDEFLSQVEQLAEDETLEAIFVEASGISDPSSIAEGFLLYEQENAQIKTCLNTVITVVDGDRLLYEFIDEETEVLDREDTDPDIINLVMDQIEFCNTIILNKCDLLGEGQLQRVKHVIRQIQPEAEIIETSYGQVELERLLSKEPFDFEKVLSSSVFQKTLSRESEEDAGITSFLFQDVRPFNREKFMSFLEEDYPEEIIRGKGYLWFSDDIVKVQLFEQAGRNATVSETSNWVAAFPKEEQNALLEDYPEILDTWDPAYGDRLNQLVLIGKGYCQKEIEEKLKSCLEDPFVIDLQ